MEPPVAPARDGVDPYAWMRDTSDPAMLGYLAAERAYYDQRTAGTARLRDELAAEMWARLAPADESAGWELGGWHYFTRTRPGLNYEQFCRRSESGVGPEQVFEKIRGFCELTGSNSFAVRAHNRWRAAQ